jgi:hypothetical protein
MSRLAKNLRAASTTADATVYVDDVFSMRTYEGTSQVATVTNGIDLAGDGGFVWAKARNLNSDHAICDTERGALQVLKPSNTISEASIAGSVTSFNSNGFTLGNDSAWNSNLYDYVSYAFKKHPKFLDIVTWTGNDVSPRTISHNLGQQPGMIWIKNRDRSGAGGSWIVYHASASSNLILNDSIPQGGTETGYGRISSVSNSDFTVVSSTINNDAVNVLGDRYVAYVFGGAQAQDFGPNQDQDIVKVGAYTGTGSAATGPVVNLGFEPQLLIIRSTSTGQWYLLDTARQNMGYKGTNFTDPKDAALWVNRDLTESAIGIDDLVVINPTGFKACGTSNTNISGQTYIYFAIRRSMKPPTSINGYFDIDTGDFTAQPNFDMSSGAPDFALLRESVTATGDFEIGARYLYNDRLVLTSNAGRAASGAYRFDYENSWYNATTNISSYSWMWARGSGFFDFSTYTATGGAQSIPHNLGVAPEMMIVKRIDSTSNWATYHSTLGPTSYDPFNGNTAYSTTIAAWNDTAPTEDYFYIGSGNVVNNGDFIAFLFATKAGMSKVGEYVGTGSVAQNIDCGFSNGARFVMIKHFDPVSLGAWWLFDTERGITVSASPYLQPSLTIAENNGGSAPNWVIPYSGGFGLTNNAPNVNQIGLTYSFYAVAAP